MLVSAVSECCTNKHTVGPAIHCCFGDQGWSAVDGNTREAAAVLPVTKRLRNARAKPS